MTSINPTSLNVERGKLSYSDINLTTDTHFGCNIDIVDLPEQVRFDELLVSGNNCKDPNYEILERLKKLESINDFKVRYTVQKTEPVIFKKPLLNLNKNKLEFFIKSIIGKNKRLEPLRKEFETMLLMHNDIITHRLKDRAKNMVVSEYVLSGFNAVPREVNVIFTETYIKAILKLFLSDKIVSHVKKGGPTNYTTFRSLLNDLIDVNIVYGNIVNCSNNSIISFKKDPHQVSLSYYGVPGETKSIRITKGKTFNLDKSSMYMLYHQFLYDAMDIAMKLQENNFLPNGYLYNEKPVVSIPEASIKPVEIKNPVLIAGKQLKKKIDKVNSETQELLEINFDKDLQVKLENLTKDLQLIGTDSSRLVSLKSQLKELQERINKNGTGTTAEVKQIDELKRKIAVEQYLNKLKTDKLRKELSNKELKLNNHIVMKNEREQELELTIDGLTQELKSNQKLNIKQKEELDEQIDKLKNQLESDRLEDDTENKLLKSQFDILKTELEQAKNVIEENEETFISNYGLPVIISVSLLVIILMLFVAFLAMKKIN